MWRSLVARTVRDGEVVCSNHITPTKIYNYTYRGVAQLVARTAGGREVARSNRVTPTTREYSPPRECFCYNSPMRASVERKKQLASAHDKQRRNYKRIAQIIGACFTFSALFITYSAVQAHITETNQRQQQKEAFAALDRQVAATIAQRVTDAKQAESDARQGTVSPLLLRLTTATPNCDLTNPTNVTVVVNKKHCFAPKTWAPGDLEIVDDVYSLRQEAATAYITLSKALDTAKLPLALTSAYRSYEGQQEVYNDWQTLRGTVDATDSVSARPGYSEHQTGLAIDVKTPGCTLECFATTDTYHWLQQHAAEYGFIERYPSDLTTITGYAAEPWHWRYIGPKTALDMKKKGIKTLEAYYGITGGDYSTAVD